MPAAGELRCVDAAIESVLEDIDSAFLLKEEHRTRSLHGFVPVTPEAEAPRCAKAASRCFSLRCGISDKDIIAEQGERCTARIQEGCLGLFVFTLTVVDCGFPDLSRALLPDNNRVSPGWKCQGRAKGTTRRMQPHLDEPQDAARLDIGPAALHQSLAPSSALFAYSAGHDLRNERELKQGTVSGMVVPQLITVKRFDMTWRQTGRERLELIGRQKYEGVEGAGGIVYELSEVDHHRGSQAKANNRTLLSLRRGRHMRKAQNQLEADLPPLLVCFPVAGTAKTLGLCDPPPAFTTLAAERPALSNPTLRPEVSLT
ncbi:unnamed protein product [Pleuronectes platessa]|uniref:Uncharacterized protein n=1 Tax=Pleuronectes platessa TaxID=8262 RepID=A0A9N7W034_PLEPL|nr:unnamed protein product [Pleuronectes platessa]